MKHYLVFCLMLISSIYSIMIFTDYFAVKSWEETKGFIINKERDNKTLRIQYIYNLNGSNYIGSKFRPSVLPFPLSVEDNNNLVSKKKIGEQITVYYNPDSHKEGLLTKKYGNIELFSAVLILVPTIIYFFLKLPFMAPKK